MTHTDAAAVHVSVLLFGMLREVAGTSRLELELAPQTTGEGLFALLADRYPGLDSYADLVRLARNEEYVDLSVSLADGDEVALIPPVSGG